MGQFNSVAGISALVVLHAIVAVLVDRIVTVPYMDEPFHVPQAQAYCQGRLLHWDPKITTPPGLYLASIAILWPIGFLLGKAELFDVCGLNWLRATNLFWAAVLYYVIWQLSRQLHKRATLGQHRWNAVTLSLFPVCYLFNFLYYTDTASTALVLLAYLRMRQQRHWQAAAICGASLLFRQTNAVWTVWIAGLALVQVLQQYTSTKRNVGVQEWLRQPAIHTTFDDAVCASRQIVYRLPTYALRACSTLYPYALVLLGFLAFLIWNGGIVLGDRSNHIAILHVPQLFYFSCFTAGLSALHVLLARKHVYAIISQPIRHPILWSTSLVIVLYSIHHFTFEHPFLLGDNRHITFYIWRRIFRFHPAVKYLLAPAYVTLLGHMLALIARQQTVLWCLGYIAAVCLVLIPSPLLEFRYYILPFFVYRLHIPMATTARLQVESALYLLINAFILWLFLYRPFQWEHVPGEWQRFMW